ncbi:MAG TPA: hypothetical protein V6C97_16250, partial [Oculatellaceae cyanobacterium]
AIRDSISHFKYTINFTEDSFEILFDNDEEGYAFHERFTASELFHFFDLHTVLYKIQLYLILIFELIPLLSVWFLKRPIAT